ncbi:hypothetical protein V2G26_004514 [Clonostachys chloroleuca]
MILQNFRILLVAIGPLVAAASDCSERNSSSPVKTTSGRFLPYFSSEHPEVASFLDIPFAESPVGPLRFAPPVPRTAKSTEAVLATELPPGCFQYVLPMLEGTVGFSGNQPLAFQRGDYRNTSEDCLRLSVFAPKHAGEIQVRSQDTSHSKGLPVLIWVHGGGYSIGGNNIPYQLAPSWVSRSQSHIVVQIQYRLNLLGFPNAAGIEQEGRNLNLGLLDQRLAIEWVRDNIGRFGGDPSRITLWGQSAGAYATDSYLFAWAKDPIVSGVIASSGNAVTVPLFNVDHTNNTMFSVAASKLGCGNLAPADELACMRKVPSSDIQQYLQAAAGKGGAADDGLSFGTVADNVTIFPDYKSLIQRDGSRFPSHIPLMTSTTTDEGTAVVPFNFNGSETAPEIPADYVPVAEGFRINLQCTTLQEAQLRYVAGGKTFQYMYGGNFSDISPRPWLGAFHGSELPLVFGTYGTEGPATDLEKETSQRMQDLFLAFMSNPNKGLVDLGWPEISGTTDYDILKLGTDGKVEQMVSVNELREECLKAGWDV